MVAGADRNDGWNDLETCRTFNLILALCTGWTAARASWCKTSKRRA